MKNPKNWRVLELLSLSLLGCEDWLTPRYTPIGVYQGRRQGLFQARVGKIRREAPKKNRLPTLVFSLTTLPYVTVAHPAHRTEADLREKASLAPNQEGTLPSTPLPSV